MVELLEKKLHPFVHYFLNFWRICSLFIVFFYGVKSTREEQFCLHC